MGKVTIEGVQELFHLDVKYAKFPAWEEILDFEVDGVQVKAIATHTWREESVRIVEPFQVEGRDYLYNFCPPLIALGAAMIGRTRALAARGLTVRDDCIRMATGTFREHSTYLRIKPDIDREQEAVLSVFRDELEMLFTEDANAQEHFMVQKLELRRKLRDKEVEPKPYQKTLEDLRKQAELSHEKYFSLQSDIARELEEIKTAHIQRALMITPSTAEKS